MATTSLWAIKGRMERLIDYIENPEKTLARPPNKETKNSYPVGDSCIMGYGVIGDK